MRRRIVVFAIGLVAIGVACTPPAPPPPSTTAPPAPTTTAAPNDTSWEDAMLTAVNQRRSEAGAPALVMCGTLRAAAAAHSKDQADHLSMSHTGSDGSEMNVRANRAGYVNWTSLGENVAMGQRDVNAVMTSWMNSAGHRTNILDARFTHAGFGRATGSNGALFWTQNFGKSGTC